jgi:hypothetical protein
MVTIIDNSSPDADSAGAVSDDANRIRSRETFEHCGETGCADGGGADGGSQRCVRKPMETKAAHPKGRRPRPRRKTRLGRGMTLEIAAKEYIWLWDLRHGVSTKAIAMNAGVSVKRVRFGVARAKAQERPCPTETALRPPPLIPFFPLGPFNPDSACGHRRPIQPGSLFCCMVCHRSGMDDHPALQRNPLTDPAPELKPPSTRKRAARETRKQRRQRIYGAHP